MLTDSGLKGTFTEYDEDHKAIATYKMDYEKSFTVYSSIILKDIILEKVNNP